MPGTNAPVQSARFREWELRPLERVLLVRGEIAAIGGRAFDVLLALVERQGHVVTKGELLDAAWPGLVVEENNVSVQIAALRKVLGAQTIATVAGIGYRLAAAPVADPASDRAPLAPPARAERTLVAPQLLGRDADIDTLVEQVGTLPLVSITGTGGVGKTSLARVVLARREARHHDDVHWVDLAPLRDGALLVPLLAGSLGVELVGFANARDDLVSALAQMRALIALDNCEHLIDEVAGFVRLAQVRAPGICWLATSQEPLHVAGEVIYRLDPLDVPAPGAGLADALQCGALALLCQRAAAADRHFRLDDSNLGTAIELCRQLDGLPLAIEMAAARIAILGLQGVHGQLGQRLRLRADPRASPVRHHTLRSTFDWSHALLSETERAVFRRLEPFLGGFTVSMAQQLAADVDVADSALDESAALEALGALIDKSLVHRSADAPDRFFLFESARSYAAEQLAAADETPALRTRHAEVVSRFVAAAASDFARLRDEQWAATYVSERHNVRAALAWACEAAEPDTLARLVAALALIDSFVQSQAEIVQCAVPMPVLERAAPALRAVAWLEFSWAHYTDGSREIGTELALRALNDFRSLGDTAGEYRALAQLTRLYESRPSTLDDAKRAWEALQQVDTRDVPLRTRLTCEIAAGLQHGVTRSVARLQELEHMARSSGFGALAAVCRARITDELLIERRFDEVVATAQRCLDAGEFRPRVRGLILLNQALALVQLGREREAHGAARAALRALPSSSYVVAATFALAAARDGRLSEAALMTGYAESARRARDERPDPAEADAIAETAALLRDGLAAERLEELTRIGADLSPADLVDLALPA